MSIETEIKIKIEDPVGFCRKLAALKAEIRSPRHFEDNHLLDFPDRKLSSGRCLLRVRMTDAESILTFKGPAREEGIFKTREELETGLEDGPIMLQILERLGMSLCFRYQKYRQEYALDGLHISVDETPIGCYVELEGTEEGIRSLARRLGADEAQFLRASYHSLYLEYCQAKGETPKFMTF